MSRLIDIIRSIFVSLEMAWILIVMASYFWLPDFLSQVGNRLLGNPDVFKFLMALPFVFAGAAFRISGILRSPVDAKHNKQLYEWSGYIRIKDRAYVGFALCIISSIAAVTVGLFASGLSEKVIASILFASIGVAGIAVFTVYLASHKLKEILVKYVP